MAVTDEERLIVNLEARINDFEKRMKKAEGTGTRSYQSLRRGSRTATQQMERDMVRSSNRINQALATTSTRIGTFGKSFAVGLAGGAITAALAGITSGLTATVKGIASIGDEAKRSGLGLEAFQQWKFVAEQNRIGVDQLVDGFKELALRSDEFVQTGGGPALESFRRLGMSSKDVARALEDPSEMMLEVMRRMEGMDKAAQIRIADELFGGSAGERFVELLSQGEEGLRRTIVRAREVGAVLDSEMINKAQDVDRRFSELATRVGGWFKLLALDIADVPLDLFEKRLSDIFGSETAARSILGDKAVDEMKMATQITEHHARVATDLRGAYLEVSDAARLVGIELSEAALHALALGNEDLSQVLMGMSVEASMLSAGLADGSIKADEFDERLQNVRSAAADALGELSAISGQDFSGLFSNLGSLGELLSGLASKAAALRSNLPGAPAVTSGRGDGLAEAEVWRQIEAEKNAPTDLAPTESARPVKAPALLGETGDVIGKGGAKGGGSKKRDRFADDVSNYKAEIAGIMAEAEALNSLALSVDEYGIAADVARKKAELLTSAQESGKKITPELSAEIDQLAQQYAMAAEKAELARERHDKFQSAVAEVKGTLGHAFSDLVTGAGSFRDALSGVITKLAEMAAAKSFEGLWNMGGVGISGVIGGLLSLDTGGYTGDGPRMQPAGVVHRGEYVFSKKATQALGVGNLEAMHSNAMKGYAAGGYVGGNSGPARNSRRPEGSSALSISIGFDGSIGSLTAMVQDEAGKVVARATPGIVQESMNRSVRKTGEIMRSSKSFGGQR